ncbi:MAG TPA: Crp/Fnr family transcriptional regulator [Chitinophagales bacterium]|jgi:CRP-like cAMP-binding protein|nr:Crp/Fnr family transcriptional regulator [Chitinophagales bacterium]MBP6155248.1 Crp/Fnr family transcriptional regulator [Chitinophagales bacterium]HQV77325.1 Crp/Fnr family transcriptional regulator [Chitinophagales bacterium]HQW78386.1 Crp/Fnr family transcriptional regulator [Chitinophagales bacterium]HRB19282.1 Crp/Fnr family transcriptional regulator [Chitinophagales bacterium]
MSKKDIDIELYREQLKQYLLRLYPSTNTAQLTDLCNQFTFHKFDKRQMILKAGEFSNTVYFICKGLVRIYYVKEDKEITNWFIKENMLFAATYSILTNNNNYSNYEALEDTHVIKLDYDVMESFYAKYHSLEHLGRKIIEAYYGAFMKKTFDVLFLSAEERYNLFAKDNLDLLNRVPLRFIASYLGITQETLSRLRSKSTK